MGKKTAIIIIIIIIIIQFNYVQFYHTDEFQNQFLLLRLIIIIMGKAMANYPKELAHDAVCQSHTGHMTGLWFLPTRPLRMNTNE